MGNLQRGDCFAKSGDLYGDFRRAFDAYFSKNEIRRYCGQNEAISCLAAGFIGAYYFPVEHFLKIDDTILSTQIYLGVCLTFAGMASRIE